MLRPRSMTERKLPVIVLPDELTFYVDDRSSHKKILTLFNPYDIPLNYKVFCNASENYMIENSQGSLKPKCRIDIPVRHTAPFLHNCGTIEKVRVQVYERLPGTSSHSMVLGRKDVVATLVPSRPNTLSDSSKSNEADKASKTPTQPRRSEQLRNRLDQSSSSPSLGVIIAAIIMCITALMFPTVCDQEFYSDSLIPAYFHLTVTKKIVAAFILGMLSAVFVYRYTS